MPQEQYPDRPARPISPDEVVEQQREQFPREVFEEVNRLLGETAVNGYAVIQQDDIENALVARGLNRSEIYRRGWMNIEESYREAGWKVEYDKPAYNESYPATFTFRKAKERERQRRATHHDVDWL